MHAVKTVLGKPGKQALLSRFDHWLKLYPAHSADDLVERFKRSGARTTMKADDCDTFIRSAYVWSQRQDHIGYVPRAIVSDFGIMSNVAYPAFRERIRTGEGGDIKPLDPWKIVLTAAALAKIPEIYVPDRIKIFCVSDFPHALKKQVPIIEIDHGQVWLHFPWTTLSGARLAPEDWVLFDL